MAEVKAPSFSQMAKAAGLPVRIKSEPLAALGSVTWLSAHADTATLPDTGEDTEGFLVNILADDGRLYESFVGGKALVGVLARAEFPFRARIVKEGRTWVFVD